MRNMGSKVTVGRKYSKKLLRCLYRTSRIACKFAMENTQIRWEESYDWSHMIRIFVRHVFCSSYLRIIWLQKQFRALESSPSWRSVKLVQKCCGQDTFFGLWTDDLRTVHRCFTARCAAASQNISRIQWNDISFLWHVLYIQYVFVHQAHAACSQVLQLPSHRTEALTWHDNAIPNDEIWVKVGGDKGGGSFKMSFQVM